MDKVNLDFWKQIDSTDYGIVGPVGNIGCIENFSLKDRLNLQKQIITCADKKEWLNVGYMLQDLCRIYEKVSI